MARHKAYVRLDSRIEIAETVYKSPLWDKERRFIKVRQEIRLRPRAAGKQLKLFGEEELYRNYRYSLFVANLTLPAKSV